MYKFLFLSKYYQIHRSLGDPTKKRFDIFYCKQWVAKLLMTAFSAIIHKLFVLETLILAYVIINKNTDCHFGSELWNDRIAETIQAFYIKRELLGQTGWLRQVAVCP